MVSSTDGFLTAKRIIITGGTGFIGSHVLIKILAQNPSEVLLLSRGSKTDRIRQHLSHISLKVYQSSDEYIDSVFKFNPDYLFLLGGNADPRLSLVDPRSDLEHNLLYNFSLFDELKKSKKTKVKIIYMSSVAVYGENNQKTLKENTLTIPMSPYGINKLAMEGYIRYYAEKNGIGGFSIRLFSTYGPKLYKQVVYDFIKELLKDKTRLVIRGDGSEIRDLSYVDDQVDGLLLLAKKAKYQGEVYNLGSGVGTSISDLALKISNVMKVTPTFIYEKENKETHHGKTWVADVQKVKQLGHSPKVTIDEGLRRTIEWIKTI